MNLAHIDELDAIEMPDGFVWRPVRRHFGIQAFGTNAYTSGAGGQIVEEHTEQTLGHEEIYLVLRGRVRFTVDGNDARALGPGQLVYLRDPSLRRGAVALTDDAAVLAIGGKPGRRVRGLGLGVHVRRVSPPRAGRYRRGEAAVCTKVLEAKPGNPAILYDLACAEALAGETRRGARASQRVGRAPTSVFREYAQTDEDFASIRDDPRFPALASRRAGEPRRRARAAPAPDPPPAARRAGRLRGPLRARASRRATAGRLRARTPCAPARRRTGRDRPPAATPRRRRPT